MAFKLCPEICLNFFFWWEGEEEECSEGIHRTFQNRPEILPAGRIGVGLVLKSPFFWKGPKTRFFFLFCFILFCLICVFLFVLFCVAVIFDKCKYLIKNFERFSVLRACCSRGPNLSQNSDCQCLYSQKGPVVFPCPS